MVRSSSQQQQQGQEELGVEGTDDKGDEEDQQATMTEVEPSTDMAVVEEEEEEEEKQQAHDAESSSLLSVVPEAVTATMRELFAELERQETAPRLFIFTGFEKHQYRRPQMATTDDASDAADGQTAARASSCGESADSYLFRFESFALEFSLLRVLFFRVNHPYLNGNAEVGAGRAGDACGYGYVRALRVFHSSDLWAAPGFDNDSNFERFDAHPTSYYFAL